MIEPRIPKVYTGKRRVDDRRAIFGIMHRCARTAGTRSCRTSFGAYATVFNRYNLWSKRGLGQRILSALEEDDDAPLVAMIDSTSAKAHRSAAVGNG